jgi:segregation and condensation protein A
MEVMRDLQDGLWKPFQGLLGQARSRDELVLTFLALLELVRTGRIALVQGETFGEIRVKVAEAA